ncbi:restriction endonuclease subunit S [Shewanella electrodiphila]|uniref:Restriction endonuclease subunit S n=1 Tax=Shewanella electrodiphila TaxID=934143 RepID=A0ABT0KUJ5_9GAMM|nr:restriction endonuclease subunit S [Shewanella electrodiphila]MCL1047522.1 restriction endonuclease subunit S [Shewanella electrodiphila]
MSNLYPRRWVEVVLGEYAHIKARIGWRGLSSSEYTENGPYLIAGTHIKGLSVDWGNCDHISEYRYDESQEIQLKEMDVVISKDGTIGRLGFIENMPGPATINGTMMLVRPNDDFFSKFIYYYLQGDSFQTLVKEKVSGSSVPHIFQRDMVSLKVPLPPLPEQQKIAVILTSVDEVIEKTQAQIDKLKDLKTAMMQELLLPSEKSGVGTKQGTGDGASYIPHSEFKDSPVGRIPKSWGCVQLESLLQSSKNSMRSGPFGSALLKHELVPNGHPYLGIDNVHIERFENKFKRYVTDEKFEQLKRYAVKENDVMITIMGTVGRSCVVPKGLGKALSSKHVWTMTFDQTKYISTLVCWQLNYSDWVKLQFKNESQGGVMESISSKTLKELWLPLPPIQEQNKINQVHNSLSEAVRSKEELLLKQQSLKKALMQDLLTGKVRVQVD